MACAGVENTRAWAYNGATIQAPFLWQSGSMPPAGTTEATTLWVEDGRDLYVETDCNADGNCAGGTESHLMVSNPTLCISPGDPWLDTVTGRCRNDTVDPVADALADLESRVSALEGP